jgi:DNA-binding CsgD family transcriptional regulator
MKTTFNINSFDFDKTHKTHQAFAHIGLKVGKVISDKLLQLAGYQDDNFKFGGSIDIVVNIHAPKMDKVDTAAYIKEYDICFEVRDSERIVVSIKPKGMWNPDNITKTERSYLQEMIDGISNKVMADDHNKSIETVKSHTKSIRFKLKCYSRKTLKKYVDIHKLLV